MPEVSVEFIKGEKYLTWYSDDFSTIRHMKKLQEDYPDDVKVIAEDDNSMVVHMPVKWFREPKPKIKREMTEEQRLAAQIRMKNARSSKLNK